MVGNEDVGLAFDQSDFASIALDLRNVGASTWDAEGDPEMEVSEEGAVGFAFAGVIHTIDFPWVRR